MTQRQATLDRRRIEKMDMTPMIDVVFQLIIFFMLVMEITQTDLELMRLPPAEQARPDQVTTDRLVVNVAWRVDQLALPHDQRDSSAFEYRIQGDRIRRDELGARLERFAMGEWDSQAGVSDGLVIVRCDGAMDYRAALALLAACQEARIWRVELATKGE